MWNHIPLLLKAPDGFSFYLDSNSKSSSRVTKLFMICPPPTAPVSSFSSSLVIFSHTSYFSVTQSQQPLSLFMAFAHVVPSACTCLLLHCLSRLPPYPSGLNLHVIPPTSAITLCLCPIFSFMTTYHSMYLLYTPVYFKKSRL